jgi:hypothetical protein
LASVRVAPALALGWALALFTTACVETSPAGVVVAPVASASAAVSPAPIGDASLPDGSADASGRSSVDAGGAPARYRACGADTDCVAAPRVGCCHNGWNEAVAASQKDAYEASFLCPDAHPICAMFIVRDARVPACDPTSHLCVLVSPPAK